MDDFREGGGGSDVVLDSHRLLGPRRGIVQFFFSLERTSSLRGLFRANFFYPLGLGSTMLLTCVVTSL